MGRPKKIADVQPAINTPKENLMDRMLIDSLSRYEKTMQEFVPLIQQLIERINILINKPVIQNVQSEPVILSTPFNTPPPTSNNAIPQITNNLSERQIWYFSTKNVPSEFIKQQCGKDKWQDLTKEEAIRLIGEWKSLGEKPP